MILHSKPRENGPDRLTVVTEEAPVAFLHRMTCSYARREPLSLSGEKVAVQIAYVVGKESLGSFLALRTLR